LIDLYAKEDLRFGVVLEDGIVKNTDRPLFPLISYLKQKYGDLEDVPKVQTKISYEEAQNSEEAS